MSLEITVISFIITGIFLVFAEYIAKKLNIVDTPDKRKIHKVPTPRAGGIAIFLSLVIMLLMEKHYNYFTFTLLATNLIIFGTGILDDIYDLNAWVKLLCQFIAATIIIFAGGIKFTIGGYYSGIFNTEIISILISYLWIIGVTNAINLIDGMDGLAAGISFFSFGAIIIISFLKGYYLPGIVSSILLGSLIAFLNYNLPPAKMFLGDSGSLLLGFNIAVLSLSVSYKTGTVIAIIFPSLFVLIPIADTAFAFFRRLLEGKNPLTNPDNKHIHHRLLLLKLSHNQALIIFYFFSGLFTTISITLKSKSILKGIIFSLSLILLFFLSVYLFEKNKFDEKIERFNNFTDRLKQVLKKDSEKENISIFAINLILAVYYICIFFVLTTHINTPNKMETITIFLLTGYIISSLLLLNAKTAGKMIMFIEYWIDFVLVYLLTLNGFELIIQIAILIIAPFFLYRLFAKKNYIVLIPLPEDIFLFFAILNIYILKNNIPYLTISTLIYPAILYIYKKIIINGNHPREKHYIRQSLIFTLLTAAYIFNLL